MAESSQQLKEAVSTLETVVFGAKGTDGLVQQVKDHGDRLGEIEQHAHSVSAKWLIMMTIVMTVLQSLLTAALRYLPYLGALPVKH